MSMDAVAVIVGLLGLTMVMVSFGLVSKEAGPPTWDARKWKPIWHQRGNFVRGGFELYLIGMLLALAGCILRLL